MRQTFLRTLLVSTVLAGPGAALALQVQAGIGYVAVTDAAVGSEIVLETSDGQEAGRGNADAFGSLIFRRLPQGEAFVVRHGATAEPVTVLQFADHPDESFYRAKTLVDGYQYVETRDGTLLAVMVRPPLGRNLADGPFPTVIEYSGYDPANPGETEPLSLIASALGYATVGVNMRGSGCSGGVIDLFDLPTTADGYDLVETVAVQPWVLGGKVGMVGISFSGISQLFVGGARPPHLAALTPLSTISDIYRAPGFPGGIFNNGFAQSWLEERRSNAEPAPSGGQGWARRRVNEGDTVCLANQQLRLQTEDPIEATKAYPFYTPSLMDSRSPSNWVGNIAVPIYYSSAWQDEQTGGDFAFLLDKFPQRPDVKLVVSNGVHTTPLDPAILFGWLAFLDIYVAERIPSMTFLAAIAPIIYPQVLGAGTPVPPVPGDRFANVATYDEARALFEADRHVRVLMENGAGSPTPGIPAPTFELGFTQWPPKEAKPKAFALRPRGGLGGKRGRNAVIDEYRPDPEARPQLTLPTGDAWAPLPPYDWRPLVDGTAVAYATRPLTKDVTIVGPSSVDLWLRSSAPDTDVQVTLSEIRPDGQETYVQSGWLRASRRALDEEHATKLSPRVTHLEEDAAPLPSGKFALVRVELFAAAHVFRKGSRIRLSVEAPGGDRAIWSFDTPPTGGTVVNEISLGGKRASRLVLPVVKGADVPEALPPCPSLRGQPCRTYVPAANGG